MDKHASSSSRRRGSALVMVLGILAVLLLMAVAFSTFVRTERSSSTGLKNGIVARSSLYTALGRVMDAIDLSFDSPLLDYPVAVWPNPWLASDGSPANDYFQSAELGDGESAGAHVLTAEIAQYLTPSQLALARSARCNWAPIVGSVSAFPAREGQNGGLQGVGGRPTGDDLLGRYAFIALDTTGLADLNMTGGGDKQDRAENLSGGDTLALLLPSGKGQDTRARILNPYVKNPDSVADKRSFSSILQARKKAPTAFDESSLPTTVGAYYPVDLFAGFAPSLESLAPDGKPKIFLPPPAVFDNYSAGMVKNMLARTFNAMAGVFGRSRALAGDSIDDRGAKKDMIPMFQSSSAAYNLPRSVLAAVALMDGLDKDFVPGQCNAPSVNYLSALPALGSNVVNGSSVVDLRPAVSSYLDFPCTESAPLVDTAYAYVEWDEDYTDENWRDDNVPNDFGDTITYHGTLYVGVRGHFMNRTAESSRHNSSAEMIWEAMEGEPRGGTVSGDDRTDIRDDWLEMEDESGGRTGGGRCINWDNFFDNASGTKHASFSWDDNSNGARGFSVDDELSFEVECGVYGDEEDESTWKFYPPTAAAYRELEEGQSGGDVYIPIRFKVVVRDSDTGKTQQQVPAPALESAGAGQWWIRVNPCVFHGENTSFGGDNQNPAWGWAFCAAPAFACDTTSLLGYDQNRVNFWLSDISCRSVVDPDDPRGGAGECDVPEIEEVLWSGPDPNGAVQEAVENASAGRNGDVANWLQFNWLLLRSCDGSSTYESHVKSWMDHTGHAPDMLHKASKNGKPFVVSGSSVDGSKVDWELYTRFPKQGYSNLGELGSVMCGPLETLSVFQTFRDGTDGGDNKPDFHPVMDYFTTSEDRYPTSEQIKNNTDRDGIVDWDALSGAGTASNPYKDLFSAVHNGRVNLNAPSLVECSKVRTDGGNKIPVRGRESAYRNPYPIATVLNGAPYPKLVQGSIRTNQLTETQAFALAADLCRVLENPPDDADEMWGQSRRFSTNDVVEKAFVRDLSFLGAGTKTGNPFLANFVALADPACDHDREALLGGIIDGFSTRGQTYLVIIRADAYSPKFGENASVEDGTTLATTHALVELFRDPMPAVSPDGSLPQDGDGNPVVYHNWYVRSFRVF